jgi:dipeptidyl aminopeptidase/acylaminoacyl peptidase
MLGVWVSSGLAAGPDAGVALLPREVLLGNPERTNPQLSPDGARLAWLAPDDHNVLQVMVKPLNGKAETAVTNDRHRGIRTFWWAQDSGAVLYLQDADGDENFHLFLVDLSTRLVRDLTPWQGVRANLLATHARFPDHVLVEANARDRKAMDVYRVNLRNGATELDTQNPGDVTSWHIDSGFVVRGATAVTRDGATELRTRETSKSPWKALITASVEENVSFIEFTEDGRSVSLSTTVDADTDRVIEKSLKTGAERALASSEKSDVLATFGHPTRKQLRAVAFDVAGRRAWTTVDYNVKADFDGLAKLFAPAPLDGGVPASSSDFAVVSVDNADAKWVVAETRDVGPLRFWLWDRKAKKAELLFSAQPKLEGVTLAPTTPVSIAARDGLALPGYLTRLEAGKPQPLVLLVHGGPWGRDSWGFSGAVQLLANRGYAVLQVNFRSSTGYGKRFLNAGNRQWGLAMQDDLSDAVSWAVAQGITDAKRVAIMGGSYGGYATLAGLAFTPDTFACGVDVVGPSNLFTLLATVPPYWAALRQRLVRRMGDPDDPKDKELLTRASPLFSADKIRVPLLIGQGANDPRVKQAEADQLLAAMEKKGLPATYVLYPDEGHGFARPENRTDFYARAELFLAKCLGGRAEPLPKEGRVPGSTGVVRVLAKK